MVLHYGKKCRPLRPPNGLCLFIWLLVCVRACVHAHAPLSLHDINIYLSIQEKQWTTELRLWNLVQTQIKTQQRNSVLNIHRSQQLWTQGFCKILRLNLTILTWTKSVFKWVLPQKKTPPSPSMYIQLQGVKSFGLTRIQTYDHLISMQV